MLRSVSNGSPNAWGPRLTAAHDRESRGILKRNRHLRAHHRKSQGRDGHAQAAGRRSNARRLRAALHPTEVLSDFVRDATKGARSRSQSESKAAERLDRGTSVHREPNGVVGQAFGSSFADSFRIFSAEASLDGINSQALDSKWCGRLGGILEGDGLTAAAPAATDGWRGLVQHACLV